MALTEAEEFELLSLERDRANASAAPVASGGGTLFSVTKQDLSNIARPVLELGGAMGGSAIGAAGGAVAIPGIGAAPGAVAGGAVGYGAGKAAADLLDRTMGLKKPIQSVAEGVTEAGSDLSAGMGMEVGGKVVGKAIEAIPGAAKATGKGLLSVLFGPPVKDIEARFANNEAIKNAKPFDVLARELPADVEKLSKHVGDLSDKALDTLSTSKYLNDGAMTRDSILKAVKTAKTDLGRSVSDATVAAKKTLTRYAERLSKLGPTISQNEAGALVRDIDNDIDWAMKDQAPQNQALEGLRTSIDTALKTGNKAYEVAMEPVAEATRILKKGQQIFNLERVPGEGYKATNATATNLRTALKEGRVDSQDVLDFIKNVTGRDYLQAGDNAAVAERFAKGATNGSRRVNIVGTLGSALGAGAGGMTHGAGGGVVGATIGAPLGVMAGGYLDVNGPPIAGNIIDQLVKLSRAPGPARSLGLQDAIAAATNYLKMRGSLAPIRP